jgi:two-component system, NarL family, captular synthesis response regulator RcsB
MTTAKIQIVIADDHPALLAGIKHELSAIPTIEVKGLARNSTEIVDLLSRITCDILVTDYAMPGGQYGDGITLLSFLRRRYPNLKIVVFTTIDNRAIAAQMAQLGVHAVLNKIDDMTHLISAVHAVYAGASYVSASMQPHGKVTNTGKQTSLELTQREVEVIRLYVSGMSINAIADQLHRTKQTISAQKISAMRKLGVKRDIDLLRIAQEHGFVVAPERSATNI